MLHKSLAAVVLGAAAVITAQNAGPGSSSGSSSMLYVSSYSGKITALALDKGAAKAGGGGGGGGASFLALDAKRNILFSCDEGFQSAEGNGTLFALQVEQNGSLRELGKQKTQAGPVFMGFFGANNDTMAIPHFGGKAVSVWNVADPSKMAEVQRENFELEKPGPKPAQTEAKPHQAAVDPTRKFVVAPDLGADMLRLFAIAPSAGDNNSNGQTGAAPQAQGGGGNQLLKPLQPVPVKPGSGPRHAAFAVAGPKTYMYVVTELSSEIMGFDVAYSGAGGMELKPLFTMKVHGKNESNTPEFAAASEIAVSPDNQFLLVASRNESTLRVPNFDGAAANSNAADVVSDSLSNYRIDPATGSLGEVQIRVPSGGRFPRQFSMSGDGALVAVANQLDGRVVVMERNPQTGMLGGFVGQALLDGNVTSVVFRE
ncbi:lactonase, 7-bladed beta-propeller domain-containing protein [Hirsutella rhossiliensis]|uniref:Lactonase, 7-bladed beta-propeller domain-containing protein n=1 Tax=Hirsutella rhossiliensis TaxID=111463 RepID=A0A9P8SJY2_9HYPO|nr:lactonase, 7-bladed beta-propeller domain-containing protein [Hirsutella rhossiliensis]KAH0963531.1 lactonase, 7-bladed beta-propeller domain-containing protein [Hirsutella rhossiliensis]